MRKILFMLMAILLSVASYSQTKTTTQTTGLMVSETDSEYSVKSTFPKERAEACLKAIVKHLGEGEKSATNANIWQGKNYNATFTNKSFTAALDKENATAKEILGFKNMVQKLEIALNQPKTPQPPKTP